MLVFCSNFLTYYFQPVSTIMAQASANIATFHITRKSRVPPSVDNVIPMPSINRTPGLRAPLKENLLLPKERTNIK